MKLSKYYHKTKLYKDVYAIYNSLIMDLHFVNNEELLQIESYTLENIEDIKTLLNSGIYIYNDKYDDDALKEKCDILGIKNGKVNSLYIILTNCCNLRCKYCAVKNIADKTQTKTDKIISISLMDKFIKEYIEYATENKIDKADVIFYGGEPLIGYKELKYFVENANKAFNFSFSIVTNGTLLDENIVTYCKDNNVNIGISIDGPKQINDANRVYANEKISVYEKIKQNLDLMNKYDLKPTLSITISTDILNNKEIFLLWLEKIVQHYKIQSISYNLLRFQGEEFNRVKYYKIASEFIIKSYYKFKTYLYEDRIGRKITALYSKNFFYGDCAAITGNQVVLKPNGDISICQAFCQSNEDIIGNLEENSLKYILTNIERNRYYSMLPIYRNECMDCEAIFTCGGGCFWERDINNSGKDIGFCEHSILIHKWLLEDLYIINFIN